MIPSAFRYDACIRDCSRMAPAVRKALQHRSTTGMHQNFPCIQTTTMWPRFFSECGQIFCQRLRIHSTLLLAVFLLPTVASWIQNNHWLITSLSMQGQMFRDAMMDASDGLHAEASSNASFTCDGRREPNSHVLSVSSSKATEASYPTTPLSLRSVCAIDVVILLHLLIHAVPAKRGNGCVLIKYLIVITINSKP